MQNTFMDIAHFMMVVNALFGAGVPTSEELRLNLVPIGTINNAAPGQFGPNGIYKYEFNLACGAFITVKCHKRQLNAGGGSNCNSFRFPTAQLYVCSSGGTMQHVVWDVSRNEAVLVSAVDWRDNEQFKNWSHIPVRWNSTPVRGQPST